VNLIETILKSSLRRETLPKVSIRLTEKKKGDLFYMHVSKIDRAKLKRGNDLPDYELERRLSNNKQTTGKSEITILNKIHFNFLFQR
jgi:hypothetical protein